MLATRRRIFGAVSPLLSGRAVNWKRLLFRYSDNKKRDHLTSLIARFGEIQKLYASLRTTKIEPIDWNHWHNTIKTPGIVNTYKARYEEEMKKEVKVDEHKQKQRAAEYLTELKKAEELASAVPGNILAMQNEIASLQWEKDNLESLDLSFFYRKYPGMEESFRREATDGQWFVDSELEKLDSIDFKELRKQLNDGNVRALQALSFLPSFTLGPYSNTTPKSVEDILKNYHTSIVWRASQLKTF